jgi:uncharacterized protein with NRDE domain
VCLIVIAHGLSPNYPLLVAANRDEDHLRASAPAAWWEDEPAIFGGRDLVAGGSWLAVDRAGRLAAVTNAGAQCAAPGARSRGHLVVDFLAAPGVSAAQFGTALDPSHYAPFNLLLLDRDAHFTSNCEPGHTLERGIHALSNGPLDSDWPKLAIARQGMRAALARADPVPALLDLLLHGRQDKGAGASVGVPGLEVRRSRLFIEGARYGTRASTVIAIDDGGELRFVERRFDSAGAVTGTTDSRFELLRP